MGEYFHDSVSRDRLVRPFRYSNTLNQYDAVLSIRGGGIMGQSDAGKLAIAHAMAKMVPRMKEFLSRGDMLKQDIRNVERKKTSRYKARKSYTWVKR